MASASTYQSISHERLAVAENLVLAHRHARPVVREIRPAPLTVDQPPPVARAPQPLAGVPAGQPVAAVPAGPRVGRLRSPRDRPRQAERRRHARVRGYLQRLATP